MNWNKFDRGVYLINCLAIIYDPKTKKILIGRRENDPHLKELSWCFPGGRPNYEEELEEGLRREVKTKTGLDINIKSIIFAKTYPEKREFLSIYYHGEVVGGKEKAGELFQEVKWIDIKEIKKYFTTSLHKQVFEYLLSLKDK